LSAIAGPAAAAPGGDHSVIGRPRALTPTGEPHAPARALKATLVLNPAEIAALPDPPNGVPRAALKIEVDGRTVAADVNAKALRKAKATIAQHGVDNVSVILQGKLAAGDVLAEAGLVAQPKLAKPATNPASAASRYVGGDHQGNEA
jgi:hypothetical protein